jgi:hypothetical protein
MGSPKKKKEEIPIQFPEFREIPEPESIPVINDQPEIILIEGSVENSIETLVEENVSSETISNDLELLRSKALVSSKK